LEIHRVLRPGGVYVCTVPYDLQKEQTIVRVRVDDPLDPASDVTVTEPEFPGAGNGDGSGELAYRRYGRDLVNRLEQIGFQVEYAKQDVPGQGILDTELFYCRKLRA
jgi:hypothetical protein